MFLKPVLKYLSTTIRANCFVDEAARALQQFQVDLSKSIVHICLLGLGLLIRLPISHKSVVGVWLFFLRVLP